MAWKRVKVPGKRLNSIGLTGFFTKESCACCRDRVWRYNLIQNTKDNYPDMEFLVCLDCSNKYGFHHVKATGNLWVYRDYRKWE